MTEDEDDFEDDEEDVDPLPYYRQGQPQVAMPRKGCLATAGAGCLHFIVTHIALYLCFGIILLGGGVLVKGLARLGWHGALTIIVGGLMVLAYVIIVVVVIGTVSRLGKRITGDKDF